MSASACRFVHSSDWHLERPLCGLSEVPDHLRELCVEAPYLAAERVVETAIAEKVDFVVLAGDLLDVQRAGPVGPAFLLTQFERLCERGIEVFWSAGQTDRARRWPQTAPLPPNVHAFWQDEAASFEHGRAAAAVASIRGIARHGKRPIATAQFSEHPELLSIGVVHGSADANALKSTGVDYWALGGRHNRHTVFATRRVAHYPGTPQGRSLAEAGPHGCTLVEVDDERRIKTRFVPTDVIRWHREQIALSPARGPGDLDRLLHERIAELSAAAADTDLIIHWAVSVEGRFPDAMWRHRAGEMLEALRAEHGYATPLRWSAALELRSADDVMLAQMEDEDTILGDFFREVARYQVDSTRHLDLARYLSARQAQAVGATLAGADARLRQRVLAQVAALGSDLLGSRQAEEAQA